MKRTVRGAVLYCQNHATAIHTPTRDQYYKVLKYLFKLGYRLPKDSYFSSATRLESYFKEYNKNTCISIYDKVSVNNAISINCVWYYVKCGMGITELITAKEEKPEMKMTIKDAVEYSQKHTAAIHVPTKELYSKVIKCLDSMGYVWYGGVPLKEDRFTLYDDACVKIYDKPDYDRDVTIDSYAYHSICTREIIELIEEEEPELTIVIKSDGKKVVTAECNGIKVESHCNTNLDEFSNKEGAHLVISRLFKELDSKSIHKGDIVEVETVINGAPKDTIGLQGIVTEIDGTYIGVKFPTKISGAYHWGYSESELKLIRKG